MTFNFEYCLEMIGIVAFAIFGAMAALDNGMDIFGVLVVAVVTAMGGGLVRDLIMDTLPPVMFTHPAYCAVSAGTALVVVVVYNLLRIRRNRLEDWKERQRWEQRMRYVLILCDAVGLGVFTIIGVEMAIEKGYRDNTFFVLFTGVLTGTGGGVMRDVLLCRQPLLLKREVYATAALAGAALFYYASPYLPYIPIFYGSAALIVLIRMVTVRRNINLPSMPTPKTPEGPAGPQAGG